MGLEFGYGFMVGVWVSSKGGLDRYMPRNDPTHACALLKSSVTQPFHFPKTLRIRVLDSCEIHPNGWRQVERNESSYATVF